MFLSHLIQSENYFLLMDSCCWLVDNDVAPGLLFVEVKLFYWHFPPFWNIQDLLNHLYKGTARLVSEPWEETNPKQIRAQKMSVSPNYPITELHLCVGCTLLHLPAELPAGVSVSPPTSPASPSIKQSGRIWESQHSLTERHALT